MKLKVFSVYALIAIVAISFSLTSCGGNKDKENLVKYYNSAIEFVQTPEFKDMLKNGEDLNASFFELFKGAGFQVETPDEMQTIIEQNQADPDIAKLMEDFNTTKGQVEAQVMQERMEEEAAKALEQQEAEAQAQQQTEEKK